MYKKSNIQQKYTRFQDQLIRAQRTPEYNIQIYNMLAHTASEILVSEPKAANEYTTN